MIGKYEREALERRRDALLFQRAYRRDLTPYEGAELDKLVEQVGDPRPKGSEIVGAAKGLKP